MDNTQGIPWSFTIEFDAEKAERNGYDLETLYDYVGRNVEKRFGLTPHRAWDVEGREQGQCDGSVRRTLGPCPHEVGHAEREKLGRL